MEAESLLLMDQILDAKPADQETRLMRSLSLLKAGRFRDGWLEYEARHNSPTSGGRVFPWVDPRSVGTEGDRRVVLVGEQGLGDQIMFASCIPDLAQDGFGGVLECDRRLVRLFQRSFPTFEVKPATTDEAIKQHAEERGIRQWIAMGSLPARRRNTLSDFPEHSGYLRADPEKCAKWRDRLKSVGPGPYVGISWKGGAARTRAQLRSIPLSDWLPLSETGAQFVSLQYGDVHAEMEGFLGRHKQRIHHWSDAIIDYDETAALISELDLVISVCTSVVHLAGALGRTVWVLVPSVAEWRYLIRGTRMPWYPTVRMFRQGVGEPWTAVIERIVARFRSTVLHQRMNPKQLA